MSRERGGDQQPVSSSLLGLGAAGLDFCLGLPSGRARTTVRAPDLAALTERNAQDEPHPSLLQAGGVNSQMPVPPAVPTDQLQCIGASTAGLAGLAAPAPPVEIKLFVGGVPSTMDEGTLRVLFTLFGPVSDVVILRDRVSNRHKGCAFVRMKSLADADRAIRELSIQSPDPSPESLYIRYAAGEAERLGFSHSGAGGAKPGVDEAKLFVGSLPKDIKEHEVRALFERYGYVQEVFLLRNNTGGSRSRKAPSGSAFVRFAYKEQALYAIANLAGKHVIPNTTRALEVRFAAAKRRTGGAQGIHADARDSLSATLRMAGEAAGALGGPWNEAEAWADFLSRQGDAFNFPAGPSADFITHAAGDNPPRPPGRGIDPTLDAALPPQGRPMGIKGEPAEHQGAFARLVGKSEFQSGVGDGIPSDSRESMKAVRIARDKKSHGPPGANVFIFHIPNEWTSGDLLRHFSPFGPLISARIAVDRHTRRNRGFAFVNYQDVKSAIVAVGTMDGFQVNGKRLKVRIKKGEEGFAEALMLGKPAPERGGRRRPQGRLAQEEQQDIVTSSLLEMAAGGGSIVPQLEQAVRQRREEELLMRQQRDMGDQQQQLRALQQHLQQDQLQQQLGYKHQERGQRASLLADTVDSGSRQASDSVAGVLPGVDELSSLLSRSFQLHELVPSVGLLGLPADENVSSIPHPPPGHSS